MATDCSGTDPSWQCTETGTFGDGRGVFYVVRTVTAGRTIAAFRRASREPSARSRSGELASEEIES